MYKLLHFVAIDQYISQYKDNIDFEFSYKEHNCDGIEIICCGDYDKNIVKDKDIIGVHLPFHSDWMSFWKGDVEALNKEFGSKKVWEEFYGGDKKSALIDFYQEGLEYANKVGAKYVVFHVNNSTLKEVFNLKYEYSNEEVVDTASEIINILLDKKNYNFDFLMENLWLSGLNFKDVNISKRLLEKVNYEKKGFILDTGHIMNTNLDIKTEDEGFEYIEQILKQHKEIIHYIKGIHLHQSVSGNYMKKVLEEKIIYGKGDYYDRLRDTYNHLNIVDEHKIATSKKALDIIKKVNPNYLVYEFRSNDRKDREEKLKKQAELIRYL